MLVVGVLWCISDASCVRTGRRILTNLDEAGHGRDYKNGSDYYKGDRG